MLTHLYLIHTFSFKHLSQNHQSNTKNKVHNITLNTNYTLNILTAAVEKLANVSSGLVPPNPMKGSCVH